MRSQAEKPPIEFVTERLMFRRFDETDAAFVVALHSNPDLLRFITSAAMSTPSEACAWIEGVRAREAPARGWWCVTLHDGTPVGAAVLKPIPQSGQPDAGEVMDDVEVGWRWHADYTGRGFATEAGRLLLDVGLASGSDKVIALVNPDNTASQAVCGRLGMTSLGLRNDYYDESLEVYEHRRPLTKGRRATWNAIDDTSRTDRVLALIHEGLIAFGQQETDCYRATWTLEAQPGWVTRKLAVVVESEAWGRTIVLSRDPESKLWSTVTRTWGEAPNDLPPPGLSDHVAVQLLEALDCDLGLCPLTNTMPIRRMGLQDSEVKSGPMVMAWVQMPSLQVSASSQQYASVDASHVRYTSGSRNQTYVLTLDSDGLVIDYPALATRSAESG